LLYKPKLDLFSDDRPGGLRIRSLDAPRCIHHWCERTPPIIIIGGTLQENPFFTPPEELLRELRKRRAALRGSRRTDAITSASSQAGDEIKRLQSCVNGLNPCSGACGNLDQPGLGAQCGQPARALVRMLRLN